jgi:gliding motility-associated-like protein
MHPLIGLLSGKLRTDAVLPFICLTKLLASNTFALRTRPRHSLTRSLYLFLAGVSLAASATFLSTTAQAQTYQAIPLDGGGHTSGFAQANNGRIYAYGDVFGAWRTDNGGVNWSYLNWGIPDGGGIYGTGMAVQKDNADVVYYCTGNELYKSIDGGTSWSKLFDVGPSTPRFRGTSPILIRSDNTEEVWFAGPRNNLTGWLWKSANGGKDWSKMGGSTFDTNQARTLHHSAAYPNQIWVGSDQGLYVSTNGGNSFTQVTNHPEVGMIQRFTSGSDAGTLLITRSGLNNDGGGVSRVTATDYNDINTYSASPSATQSIYFGYPTGLQIFSDNTACAWNTAGDRQGYSTDGGRTFKVRPTTLNTSIVPIWTTAAVMDAKDHPDYGTDQVIQVGSDPNHWMITGGGAAMESFDKGLSWSYFPNGSGIAAVKTYTASVSRFDENRIYIPASDIGSAIVTDGGSSGTAASSSKKFVDLHTAFRIMEGPDQNNLVIAGINQGQNKNLLLKSSDGGMNWAEVSTGNLPTCSDGITKSVMSLTDANDFLVVLGAKDSPAQKVYRTTNGGTSFNGVTGLPDNMSTGHRYDPTPVFIERDATQANVRYLVARGASFYKSTTSGASWTPVAHPYDGTAWVWGLVSDPVRSGNLWAAGDFAGIKYTTNGGTSWNSTTPYFNGRYVGSYDGKIALWGTKDGESAARLWYSPDNGTNWYAQSTLAKNFHSVQGIAVDSKGKIWVSWNSVTVVTPVTSDIVADTQKPTAPSGLSSESVTSSSFTLKWNASTDNVGVTGYEVFKDGTLLGTTTSLTYNVTGLTAGTTYSMTVRAKDAAGNYSDLSTALSVTTTAAPTYTVTFTVKDAANALVSGASVSFKGQTVASNASGVASFTNVAPGTNLPYSATKTGFNDEAGTVTVTSANVAQNIVLTAPTYTVTFTVKDAANALVAGASVTFKGQTVASNASGVATFTNVTVGTNSAYTATKTGFNTATGSVNVAANVAQDIVLTAVPTYSVTFTVKDATEALVADASVTFNGQTVASNASGIATFTNVAGGSNLAYTATRTGFNNASGTITVTSVNVAQNIVLTAVGSPTYAVTFTVMDAANALVTDASVSFNGQTVTSNASGVATFTNVAAGTNLPYTATKTGFNSINGTVTVTSANVAQSIVLIAPTYTVTFTVKDAANSLMSDASVTFNGQTVVSNASGVASFTNVAPGTNLAYNASKTGFNDENGTVTVVSANLAQDIVLTAIPTYTVTFTVKDAAEALVSGASVTFMGQTLTSNASGVAIFTNVAAGANLAYSTIKTGFNNATGAVTVAANLAHNIILSALGSPVYTVSFTVKDATEAPLADAVVSFNGENLTTTASGEVVFNNVAPGSELPYSVAKTGFETASASLSVATANVTQNVVLVPSTITQPEPTPEPEPVAQLNPRNIFSPNGDGINEMWEVEGIEQQPQLRVRIFNVYGQQVFQAQPYTNSWDGAGLPEGVYYFQMQNEQGKSVTKGAITLVR